MKSPINKEKAMQYVGIAAGYFGGNAIQNSAIGQKISNDKLRAVATILVGAFLSKKGKGLMTNVGTGIAVSGAVKLIGSVLPDNVKTMIAGDDDSMMGEIAEQIAGADVLNGIYGHGNNEICGASVLTGVDEFGDQPAS
jgi:hypothetical protein